MTCSGAAEISLPNQGARQGLSLGLRFTFPDLSTPRFAGDEKKFPLHLQVYPSTAFYDGRGASLPWLQQLPDPMSTVVWDSWVEINPKTAASLGISHSATWSKLLHHKERCACRR